MGKSRMNESNIHLRSRAQTTGEEAGLYLDEKDRVLHYEPVIRVREDSKGVPDLH